MRIGQTSFVVFTSKLVGSVLGFIATLYLARTLGAEVLGQYALVIALVAWLALASNLGFSSAITKRMSEGTDSGPYATAGAIVIAVLGVSLGIIILAFNNIINSYVGTPIAPLVIVILWFDLFQSIITAVLNGEQKVHLTGLFSSAQSTIRGLIQISLVVVGFELIGMLTGYAVATLIVSMAGLALVSTQITRPNRAHFENLYIYARFSWLGSLKSRSFNEVDILLLGVFVQSSLVGIYSAAWSIALFLTLFDSAISSTLFPEISRSDAERDQQAVVNLVEKSLTYGGLILIPGLFGGILLGERLLRIYGPEFVQAASILWILILATLVYSYQKQLLNALNGIDQPKVAFRINAAFITTNVVLNILLITALGVIGAAVATALSAVVGMVLSLVSLQSEINFSIPFDEILRQFIAATAMIAIVIGSEAAIESLGALNHNFMILLLLVTIGSITYFVILFVISTQFRSTVKTNSPV